LRGRVGFPGSKRYWEDRYGSGGSSGVGSYGKFAEFKASVLNEFLERNKPDSIIEFGCGDGNQLSLLQFQGRYLGFDISESALSICRHRFRTDTSKSFRNLQEYADEVGDLALSLDVIFHLVEEDT
jgi:SAM-dependent methyltransferase